MLNYLIPITFLTLFTAFKMKIGVGQLRPFDGCVLLLLLWLVFHIRILGRTKISIGFVALLPYFALHVISAYAYYPLNGLREAAQTSLLVGFALVLVSFADKADYEKIGRVLLVGLFGVMFFNIGWHIEHGYWSGWKRLHDPKAAFTFLPMVLALFLVFTPPNRRQIYWALWAAVGVAIIFSGERKALLVYGLLTVALISRGRFLTALPVAIAGFFALMTFATLSDDPYVARQIKSVLEPTTTTLPLSAIARGEMPASISNAAREFTLDQIAQMLPENPLFGVGTNAYLDILTTRFPYLPPYMLAGVHGEFLRVLVENGLLGLLFYVSIWGLSIFQLAKVVGHQKTRRYIDSSQAAMLPIILITPPLFYVATEASGTRVVVASILASLIPNFLYWSLTLNHRKQKAEFVEGDDGAGILLPAKGP
jgi:hypothetical protein